MRSNWRKQMMISALALTLSATNVAPVFASAAPDGKTNAADIAQTMGTTAQWNRWEKEWETLKNRLDTNFIVTRKQCNGVEFCMVYTKADK